MECLHECVQKQMWLGSCGTVVYACIPTFNYDRQTALISINEGNYQIGTLVKQECLYTCVPVGLQSLLGIPYRLEASEISKWHLQLKNARNGNFITQRTGYNSCVIEIKNCLAHFSILLFCKVGVQHTYKGKGSHRDRLVLGKWAISFKP